MSQYPPPPYPPHPQQPYPVSYPSPYGDPARLGYGNARAAPAARRASTLMWVLGPLMLLMGGCMAGVAAALPRLPSTPDLDRAKSQLTASTGLPLDKVLIGVTINGAVLIALGLTLTALAAFVRRGRRGPVVSAMVVTGLLLLLQGIGLLGSLLQIGSPSGLSGGCVGVVFTALFGLLLAWLVAALRAGPGAAAVDPYQQYLAQWYQYQQAAGAYGGGSGYAAPPGGDVPPTPPAV